MKEIIRHGLNLAAVVWLTALPVDAQSPLDISPAANQSAPIPMDQLGAVATKQYSGDGLSVTATPDGARLRCAFQRLEGEVTRDGLWLRSTVGNAQGDRFRVLAVEVGRVTPCAPFEDWWQADWSRPGTPGVTRPTEMFPGLPYTGIVTVTDNVARFRRDGLTEEYSVAVNGVRQDFIVEQRPAGEGELRVELDVPGARAEPLVNGARLVLAGSGRKLAYNRLRVTDATGRELPARMEVASGILPDVEGGILPPGKGARTAGGSGFYFDEFTSSGLSAGLEATALRQAGTPAATMLAVAVDDANAIYPVRIDPTFSDADWISLGGIPGADNVVNAAVVDGSGNLYIGGLFTVVAGDVIANRIAKWDGNSWSALGLGMNNAVRALAVSGAELYAGGDFTNAGGTATNRIAKWDGSAWLALSSGMNGNVNALAVSGTDLYAGGFFTTAGGMAATNIAKWNGSAWSALGSGINSTVFALAMSGTDLYAGGFFYHGGRDGGQLDS